jgi:ribosomal protein S18 acetylase RimI-like enzyme
MTGREPVRLRTASDGDLQEMRMIAANSFDRERVNRAGIVDLLYGRPGIDPSLNVVAIRGGEVIGFACASMPSMPEGDTGYVDAWAVHPSARFQGVGTALLSEVETRLSAAGCTWLQAGGTQWQYAWPGIDFEYTAALIAAERAGFARVSVVHNMDVDLTTWVPARSQVDATVRRARMADLPALGDLIEANFSAVWLDEVRLALDRSTPTAHVAETGRRLIGFAAHGVYQPDLFGPLGTDPAQRGGGIGRALLDACLGDMAAAGIPVAQIGWIGPAPFYARAAGARMGRTFAVLRKAVN